jgi:hypothetical protein
MDRPLFNKIMNADHDFQIGKNHLVCEDYALSGVRENDAYAIICDGCSASYDVDVGARLLALAAKETFITHDILTLGWDTYGKETIKKANQAFNLFPALHPQTLDATLLFTMVKDNVATVFLYGDGVFFHKSAKGLYALKIELSSGAPDYLSYDLDRYRREGYDKLDGTKLQETYYEDGTSSTVEFKPFTPIAVKRKVEAGDIVAVCSDGIGSFRRSDNNPIPWMELAPEFIDFKSPTGVFAKRRMATFKKKCLKEAITHGDDISVSAIIV